MEISDLFLFSPGHPPSPYSHNVEIRGEDGEYVFGRLPEDLTLYAIGWLGSRVPSQGEVQSVAVDRLLSAYECGKWLSDGTMGWHDCEICTTKEELRPDGMIGPVIRWQQRELRLYGHGHHLVKLHQKVYMCLVLILHYILDHQYRPPDEFLTAVMEGTFLTTRDLIPYDPG